MSPGRVNVQSVEIKVDASLIEQRRLRAVSLQGCPIALQGIR